MDAQEMGVYLTDNELHEVGHIKSCKILRRKVYQLRRMLRVKQGTNSDIDQWEDTSQLKLLN